MASSSTALHHQWDLLTVWGSKAEEDGWPDWRCGSEEHSGKKMGFGFIWFWLIAGNENVHLTSIFFFFNSNDVRPSNSLSYRLHLYMFKFKSFQHRFSYPSWFMCLSISLLSLGVCLCVWFTTAREPAISQPHFWGWQWDRTSWGP